MYSKYLHNNNFEKYFIKLKEKLKNKKILVYGAGQIFKFINEHFDISDLNIIGICDKQFTEKQEGKEIWGYKIININNINNYDYDCVLVSVLKYYNLGYSIRSMIDNKNIDVYALVRQEFKNLIKEFFDNKNPIHQLSTLIQDWLAFENKKFCLLHDNKNDRKYKKFLNVTEKNYQKVLKKVRKKAKKDKIRVGFLCFDSARWKCQSLYELLDKDEHFEPFIIMSRLYIGKGNQTRLQQEADYREKCEYFEKTHKVEYGYDLKKDKYIPLKNFKADYIFYQLPFYCNSIQEPILTSKNSLTAYVPYYVALTPNESKFDTFFRACLHKYFLPYEEQKEYYSKNMRNNGKNIEVSGHTSLDDFCLKQIPDRDGKKLTVIYAPHHSNEKNSPLKFGTFLEMGNTVLEYAKSHPEINWIFRPHPLLKNVLTTLQGADNVEKYYKEWQKVGIYDTSGDYMETFYNSDLLINDCGFVLEYFPTGRPIIQLINPEYAPYDKFTEKVLELCYKAQTKEELKILLDKILVEKNDFMKEKRLDLIEKTELRKTNASINILNSMKKELCI